MGSSKSFKYLSKTYQDVVHYGKLGDRKETPQNLGPVTKVKILGVHNFSMCHQGERQIDILQIIIMNGNHSTW